MVPAADAAALVAMLEAFTFDEVLSIWRRPSVGILTTDDSGERIDHGRVRFSRQFRRDFSVLMPFRDIWSSYILGAMVKSWIPELHP